MDKRAYRFLRVWGLGFVSKPTSTAHFGWLDPSEDSSRSVAIGHGLEKPWCSEHHETGRMVGLQIENSNLR